MDKNQGSSALQVMVLSFFVAAAAAAVLLVNFNGQGRLWDTLTKRDDFNAGANRMVNRYSPPDAGGSHILLGSEPPAPVTQAAAAPAPQVADAPAAAVAAAPVKDSWIKHITGSLQEYSIKGPASQRSSASAGSADAPASAAPSVPAAPAAVSVASARAPAPAAAPTPSYVNYGGSTRSDIMSSASGPVYNFAGKKR